MRKVYTARDVTDAGLVRGVLETHEIEVEVRGEDLHGARGLIPISADTAPTLWVEERDFDKAKALIAEGQGPNPNAGPSWTCSGCGETVDAELNECWSCSKVRI